MKIQSFLKLVEIQTKVASLFPFLTGVLFCYYEKQLFDPGRTALMFFSLLCLDMGVTGLNNYSDYRRARLREGYNYKEHNAMVRDRISHGQALAVIGLLFSASALTGLWLSWITSPLVLLVGGLSFAVGLAYSAGPVPLSRTPWGEALSGFFMGFVIFYLAYTINGLSEMKTVLTLLPPRGWPREAVLHVDLAETLRIFAVSLPLVLGIAGIMLANNICDREDDRINGRITLPLLIGLKPSRILMVLLYTAAFIDGILLLVLEILPPTGVLIPGAFLVIVPLLRRFLARPEKARTFVLAVKSFILLAMALTMTLAGGILLMGLTSCSAASPRVPWAPPENRFLLDTVCTLTLPQGTAPELYEKVFDEVEELENTLSAHRENSEIRRLSRRGDEALPVSEETADLVKASLEISRLSGGLFDISIAPLAALWGIGTETARIPDDEERRAAQELVDYRRIKVIPGDPPRIKAGRPGAALDLGGIAKGYAADEAARLLTEAGVERGIINFGGNILLVGRKPGNQPWWVGIQDPREPTGTYVGIVELSQPLAVVTSGIYERFFEEGGIRYHHILDPRTGAPARSGLLSVTIVHQKAMTADALSTAVFLMGLEKGSAFLESQKDTEGILITEKGEIFLSSGLEERFRMTGSGYTISQPARVQP